MPIKWSAVKVCEAMDEVERQMNLADAFFAEAKEKAKAATGIADLPTYMSDRIHRLITDIERIEYVRSAIDAVRKAIPDGAVEAERERLRSGRQQGLGF